MITSLWFTTDVLSYWLLFECGQSIFAFISLRVRKGGRDKLSLSAIIKSNLHMSGHANDLNYFVLTSDVLFYGLGKLALIASAKLSLKLDALFRTPSAYH